MAKARGVEVGDWSESGTFLRKPVSGWLHDDRDLMNSGITYKIHYLGCIEVKSSMRTLQYQTRIQVTKEAITRLAENAHRVAQNKKRKLPKMLQKLLGEIDAHWASEVNLSISVDSLKICAKSNREIMNHSLPSISFASGGDEATANCIGYVAKDPIHERACHVFECEDSQFVLTTIGQAFELRYKMYLLNPQSSCSHVHSSASKSAGNSEKSVSPTTNETPHLATPTTPPIAPPIAPRRGPPPPSGNPSNPRLSSNNLPAFPQVANEAPLKLAQATTQVKQLNIYDSTHDSAPSGFTETGDYSNPGEIIDTHQADDYVPDNTTFKTVRQMGPRDEDNIDLTPSGVDLTPPDEFDPPSERLAIYANTLDTSTDGRTIYSNTLENGSTNNDHLAASYISSVAPYNSPYEGVYDDPSSLDEANNPAHNNRLILTTAPSIAQKVPSPSPAQKVPSPSPARKFPGPLANQRVPSPLAAQNVPSPPAARKVPNPPAARKVPSPAVPPKFDDTIYAKRVDSPVGVSAEGPTPVPISQPIKKVKYFHGTVSRIEAEAMLERDGDFLVRESGKQPGQYVLTGMGGGRSQHLLLIDKQGKVKSRDREFENIPHLVDHFMNLKTPLIIGDSEVFLKRPVVNSFQNT